MLFGKQILGVVPARGGSKGVPLKNLVLFHGRPLIEWTAELIGTLDFLDQAIVSTDHEQIANIAEKAGLKRPFLRPPDLSGDRVSDFAVLEHALREMESADGCEYDVVLMLQPTSPYRKTREIYDVVDSLIRGDFDSVVTVSKTPLTFHPWKQFAINNERLEYFDPLGASVVARQDLSSTYYRNGVAYAVSRDCLINQKKVIGSNSAPLLIDHDFINIDSREDFEKGEKLGPPDFAG